MTFGQKIKKLRADNNLKQEQLAEMLYVTRTAVSKWETDKGMPGIDSLKLISSTFNISLDELISDEVVECRKKAEEKRVVHMYVFAMGCFLFTLFLILTAYFALTVASWIPLIGFIVFGIFAHPEYRRFKSKKVKTIFIISWVIVALTVIFLIVITIIEFKIVMQDIRKTYYLWDAILDDINKLFPYRIR